MIELKINNETLDLFPGATTSIESASPFFSTDAIQGEYSSPVEFPWTGKNLRLLGYPNELPVVKDKTRILDVDYSENGLHFYKGTLVIEFVQGHLQGYGQGKISGYFLMGTSNFWQRIKNKKLRDLDLGGDREFAWAGYDRNTDGFWKHIHDTWTATSDEMDYVFAPIVNEKWEGDESKADFMNKLDIINGTAELHREKNWNTLVAHPYHIYILKQIFKENDYTLSGSILDDTDFKKLFMPSLMSIYWCRYDPNAEALTPESSAIINVAKQLPDKTISDYLLSMGNKFGWGYEFSRAKKSCEIKLFKDITRDAQRGDYTNKIDPTYQINFPSTPDKVSLVQRFDGADEAIGSIDFNAINYKGEVATREDLPDIGGGFGSDKVGDAYLIVNENIYVTWAGRSDGLLDWQKIGDNIYDYVQENDTIQIETGITTTAMRYLKYYEGNDETETDDHYGRFPEIKRPGNWKIVLWKKPDGRRPGYGPRGEWNSPGYLDYLAGRADAIQRVVGPSESFNGWEMRAVFYHGMQQDDQGLNYPFSSNHCFNNKGEKIGNWALAYKLGDVGLVDTFWQFWLKVLQSNERLQATIYPKLHEYLQMLWSDIILIRNTPYIIKQRTAISPFNQKIQIKAHRLPALQEAKEEAPLPTCPDCIVPDGLQVVVNDDETVTFSFNAVSGYDYRIQYTNTHWLFGKYITIKNVQTVNGRFSYTTEELYSPVSDDYRWRIAHINCGSDCNSQGEWVNGPNFSVVSPTIKAEFSVYITNIQGTRAQSAVKITLEEPAPVDIYVKGKYYSHPPGGRSTRTLWDLTIPAGETTAFRLIAGEGADTIIDSYCYSSIAPESVNGRVIELDGPHC